MERELFSGTYYIYKRMGRKAKITAVPIEQQVEIIPSGDDDEAKTDAQQMTDIINEVNTPVNTSSDEDKPEQEDDAPFVSGYVDVYPLRNIYMTSSGLGNFNTMTITGNRNFIKKVPVSAGHVDVIFAQVVTGMDYLDCSRLTLSRISFKLIDVHGRALNLRDNHISFSIVFSRVQNGT